ncbi:MAG: VCBS repeat-containing protein [Chloracidobacterium sp.]|nr:VCBS repeat-containing protein [Chloracidobacterium sp.]
MKKLLILLVVLALGAALTLSFVSPYLTAAAINDLQVEVSEPDIPAHRKGTVNKRNFMLGRAEYFGRLRGLDKDRPTKPGYRLDALRQMDRNQAEIATRPDSPEKNALQAAWTPIGPAPIPNGHVASGPPAPVSGRTISIAIHPTNPDIVYVGTAQGGLYRTLNGGMNWEPIMDTAQSLAIGAVAISPTQPETVYVGTGEGNFAFDTFFGVGLYRIDNASSPNPTISGPFNKNANGDNVFAGRAIRRIVMTYSLPNEVWVATASGVGGIGNGFSAKWLLPDRGIYRTFEGTSADPRFKQIGIFLPQGQPDNDICDIAVNRYYPGYLFTSLCTGASDSGIYISNNARDMFPTFSWSKQLQGPNGESVVEFAVPQIVTGTFAPLTVYAASGQGEGKVFRSYDGGTQGYLWEERSANKFCKPQCYYDTAFAVAPDDPTKLYLGGGPNPSGLPFGISTDSGQSFSPSFEGLHVDSHVIEVSESSPNVIYFGSDGGIYKSINGGATWINLNNAGFSATQFMSLAVHPTDPKFTIGGTQDNGTNLLRPDGTWTNMEGGDGGYTVIDQNATDTTNVRMYHTFFNSIGNPAASPPTQSTFEYSTRPDTNSGWTRRGCINGTPGNGITCTDTATLFYAPLESGPGNPNTIYFGTDRLYRSVDTGLNHTLASQGPIESGVAISAIGISPQDDNARIVGLTNGSLWGTRADPHNLTHLDIPGAGLPEGEIPNNFISRVVFDPNNVSTVYVTLSRFGPPGTPNVFKTTNFTFSQQPDWVSISGTGNPSNPNCIDAPTNPNCARILPGVPVNSFLVDRTNPLVLYAGTDIGVFISTDGGTNWDVFGTGLPRVAVFDMAFAPGGTLRIATHGRGMYDIPLGAAPQPSISINDVSANEGNSGGTAFTFTVSLSQPSGIPVTVNYATADDTAQAGSDYTAASGTLTFNPTETSKQFSVFVTGDTAVEPNETFKVNLSAPTNATIQNGEGVGIILNDDGGAISINDVSLNEGNSGSASMTFNVVLSNAASQVVSVNYATNNGSATAGSDYTTASGTLVFSPGEIAKTITVPINGDTTVEPNETFTVDLTPGTNATISDAQGLGTIINDDTNISINDVSSTEGNSGTKGFTFNITLSPAVPVPVSVNYATSFGSATPPSDYTHVPVTTVNFNANEASKQVIITVNGDTDIEPNEDFLVSLSSPVGGNIGDGQGVGTILNDDTNISINDVALSEGNSGSTLFAFNVTISPAVPVAVSVNYATSNESATAGSDYLSANGTLTFDPNQTTKQIDITVSGDTFVEPDEIFNINLSGATGAAISDNQGKGTILNDDVSIAINDIALAEGNAGTTAFNFAVTLSGPSSQTVSVDFITDNGSATAGSDYVANVGTVSFSPGETSKAVTVSAIGDTTVEGNETFTVNLSGATNSSIADSVGTGTILNDDGSPTLSINDVSQNEGNSGTTNFSFTVNLSVVSQQAVTVNYATANGTAAAPGDYAAIPPTILTFGAGEISKQVSIAVIGDTLLEPNETFAVNLSDPSNAGISDEQGIGTIVNDDSCSYSINPVLQSFPVSGGVNSVQVNTQAGCPWTAVVDPSPGPQSVLKLFGLPERIDVFGDGIANADAPAAVFPGTGAGAIPDGFAGTPPQYGPALIISFNVSGITAPISAISVDATVQHTWVGDVEMILTAPNGTASLITVSRIGATTEVPFGYSSEYDGTYAFSDTATGPNIWTAAQDSPVPPGVYRTTAGGGPGQTDPPPVTSLMTAFGGLSSAQANGTWTLSLRDAAEQDTGFVSAANLNIAGTTPATFLSITSGASGSGSGTVNYSVGQNTTGGPRTGKMTIAGKTFTVNQSNTTTATQTRFDYDADGRADLSVRRPANNVWYLLRGTAGYTAMQFGITGDRMVPADYDGDGKTDVAVFRPSNGTWYVFMSQSQTFQTFGWGVDGDMPVPTDRDADGKADLVIYRESNNTWYTRFANATFNQFQFGVAGDKPMLGDFDGDGIGDVALFRPSNNNWYLLKSSLGFFVQTWGQAGDIPLTGDFDGDGATDQAVFRPSTGQWYLSQTTAGFSSQTWGLATDIPVAADYDGDGKTDVAVFRPSNGTWYIVNSSTGILILPFGQDGDIPTQAAFIN